MSNLPDEHLARTCIAENERMIRATAGLLAYMQASTPSRRMRRVRRGLSVLIRALPFRRRPVSSTKRPAR